MEIAKVPGDVLKEVHDALTLAGVQMTLVGAVMPEGLSFDDWCKIGGLLVFLDKRWRVAQNFTLGDWYNHGDRAYGEAKNQVEANFPEHNLHTVQNYATTARAFEHSRRRENVDWSVYSELGHVADESVRYGLLEQIAERKVPNSQVRSMIASMKKQRAVENKKLNGQTQWNNGNGGKFGDTTDAAEPPKKAPVEPPVVEAVVVAPVMENPFVEPVAGNPVTEPDDTQDVFTEPPSEMSIHDLGRGGIAILEAEIGKLQSLIDSQRLIELDTDNWKRVCAIVEASGGDMSRSDYVNGRLAYVFSDIDRKRAVRRSK